MLKKWDFLVNGKNYLIGNNIFKEFYLIEVILLKMIVFDRFFKYILHNVEFKKCAAVEPKC